MSHATGARVLVVDDAPGILVLLDLGLPDIDGLDVIRAIRTRASTPIVVLSAREAERDKVAALDLGADDYLTKPGVGYRFIADGRRTSSSRAVGPRR